VPFKLANFIPCWNSVYKTNNPRRFEIKIFCYDNNIFVYWRKTHKNILYFI